MCQFIYFTLQSLVYISTRGWREACHPNKKLWKANPYLYWVDLHNAVIYCVAPGGFEQVAEKAILELPKKLLTSSMQVGRMIPHMESLDLLIWSHDLNQNIGPSKPEKKTGGTSGPSLKPSLALKHQSAPSPPLPLTGCLCCCPSRADGCRLIFTYLLQLMYKSLRSWLLATVSI